MRQAAIGILMIVIGALPSFAQSLSPIERLGKAIFFDDRLSANGNQSCASCHDPAAGWSSPDPVVNAGGAVMEGSVARRFGNRKPPSSAYATQSPILHQAFVRDELAFVGGSFWDGRATGERLGSPAAEQAQFPFVNPLEQGLASPEDLVRLVCEAPYGWRFRVEWGEQICDEGNEMAAYDAIGRSLASYESSSESNAFTSKYDYYLAGKVELSDLELMGMNIFRQRGKCAVCHPIDPIGSTPPLLTDFTYENIGTPRNPDNPFYEQTEANEEGHDWVDRGLGDFLRTRSEWADLAPRHDGRHKVPTLRNVDKRSSGGFPRAYGHNGYFKTLEGIVHFYSTRDLRPPCEDPLTREADALAQNCWPEAEVAANVNTAQMGWLNLTPHQETAIVAFLKTLTDGYEIEKKTRRRAVRGH